MNIDKEIEKIKRALINYKPEFFRYEFCEHEKEKLDYHQEFKGKMTGGMEFNPYFRCKKCGLLLNPDGTPSIVHH